MIKNDIRDALTTAMKSRNDLEVRVFRYILSQINYAEIDKKMDLTDEEVISVLQKEMKKRKEAIELFKKGNRNDLVLDEENQLKVLSRFLPEGISEAELTEIVENVIKEIPDKSNIGRVIGQVMSQVKGRADGSLVARMVTEKIKS